MEHSSGDLVPSEFDTLHRALGHDLLFVLQGGTLFTKSELDGVTRRPPEVQVPVDWGDYACFGHPFKHPFHAFYTQHVQVGLRSMLGRIILIIDGLNENGFVGPTTYPPLKKRVLSKSYSGVATCVEP
jgi:hypothetical protein